MPAFNIYKSYTEFHEVDVDVDDDGVTIHEAEKDAMNYAAMTTLTRAEAIAAAKAILAYYGEASA